MDSRQILLAAAAALLLAGCSSGPTRTATSHTVHPKPKHAKTPVPQPLPHAPSIPSTADAIAPSGPQQDILGLLSGPVHSLSGYQTAAAGYLPSYGLLVQGWPSSPGSAKQTPGALWLVNPLTGAAKNLMGPVPPNIEPAFVYSGGHWILWGQMWDGDGGPITYYLYNLATGQRQPFTDQFTGTSTSSGAMPSSFGDVEGSAFVGDALYVSGVSLNNGCEQTGVVKRDLATGAEQPLILAQNCRTENPSGPMPSLARASGSLPLHLTGESVGPAALSGTTMYFAVTRMAPAAENTRIPTTLAALDLATGAMQDVATSAGPIIAVAADSDVVALVAGNGEGYFGIYALPHGSRQFVLLGQTQGDAVTVSGPLVGYGSVYDIRTDSAYAPGAWLFGTEVTWYRGGTLYYAPLDPSQLK